MSLSDIKYNPNVGILPNGLEAIYHNMYKRLYPEVKVKSEQKNALLRQCITCQKDISDRHPTAIYCVDCYKIRGRGKPRKRPQFQRPVQKRAYRQVNKAISCGELPPASECFCADCGKPACDYDHRDYLKPLEVDPVCRSCNKLRGPAFGAAL